MPAKPNRFAELLNTAQPVVLVTEHGVEFDITDATLDELVLLAFGLGVIDALPETPEVMVDLTLRCPICGERADMCFAHGDEWKKRGRG